MFQLLRWLVQPSKTLTEPGERRNAQLSSALLLTIIILGLSSGIIQLIFVPNFATTFVFILVAVTLLVIAYGFSRSSNYRVGALMASLVPFLASYFNFLQHPDDIIAIGFMLISIVLASTLLSLRTTIILGIINVLALIAVPFLASEDVLFEDLIAPIMFMALISSLIVLSKRHHQNIEQERQNILLQTQEDLQTSYKRLQDVLENLPIMVCAMDSEGNAVLWNDEAKRITGYAAGEMKDKDCILPLTKSYEAQDDIDSFGGKEIKLTNKSNEEKVLSYRLMSDKIPIPDWQVWGIGMDVTELKQAEETRLKLTLEQEKRRFLQEFIANISHDLKTPLSVIRVNLALIDRIKDSKRQGEKLQVVNLQTRRLEKLLKDILTSSQLDQQAQVHYQELDINELIRDVEDQLQSLSQAKNLNVVYELSPDIPKITADRDKLMTVFVNLLENAISYTQKGDIFVRTTLNSSHIVIEFEDSGIGIAEDDLPHIFESFYRADKARSAHSGGTGLGLSIVKKIIDLHNGEIDVQSNIGDGTTFQVMLPVGVSSP